MIRLLFMLLLRLFLLFVPLFPVSLFPPIILPRPAIPCTGRLYTAGVESMWVYRLSLTFPFFYVLFLRDVCVLNRLFNSSTSQTRASQYTFFINVINRRQVLDDVYIHFLVNTS